jgi:hypothetical protein
MTDESIIDWLYERGKKDSNPLEKSAANISSQIRQLGLKNSQVRWLEDYYQEHGNKPSSIRLLSNELKEDLNDDTILQWLRLRDQIDHFPSTPIRRNLLKNVFQKPFDFQ